MKRYRSRKGLAFALTIVLAIAGALFLAAIGIDALEGRSEFQFFADSPTYHEAARGGLDHIESWVDTVTVGANFLGPMVLLEIAGQNYFLVLVLNSLLLYFSVVAIAKALRIDALRLLVVLLLNPMTISSVLSVNKEILSLVFVALLLHGLTRRSWAALLAAAVASLLVRWHLTVFFLAALALSGSLNPIRSRRALTLLVLLFALSVLYTLVAPALEASRLNFEHGAEEYEGSGLYQRLMQGQESGYYWAVFPAKVALLLFGLGLRLDLLLQPTDIYNHVWQSLHSVALLAAAAWLLFVRRLRLGNDLVYLSVLYLAVFALTPISGPRYFFPVYVLWVAAALAPTGTPPLLCRSRKPPPRAPLVEPGTAPAPTLSPLPVTS